MNRVVLAILMCCVCGMSSCSILKKKDKTAKKETTTIDSTAKDIVAIAVLEDTAMPVDVVVADKPIEVKHNTIAPEKAALKEQLVPIWKHKMDFSTFKGKAKTHYDGGGMNADFTANVRLARDSVIWVHITAGMGIVNVARVLITQDSFKLVNFLDKTAVRMHIKDAQKMLPAAIDFNLLQSFIIGEALTEPIQELVDITDFGGTWTLHINGLEADQQVAINKADSTLRSQQVLSTARNFAAMIQYGEYSMVNDRKFAGRRAIAVTNQEQPHQIEMAFNNAVFDEAMTYPFTIPDSYTIAEQ